MVKLSGKAKAAFLKRMAKGRKAALKARGGKKSKSGGQAQKYVMTDYRNGKKIKRDEMLQRIEKLERIIIERGINPNVDIQQGSVIAEHKRLKEKIDAGDW
tara:strand:- start:241 stop:543 length:303 start_codon:yes stop_codon:yes gene_type:complete